MTEEEGLGSVRWEWRRSGEVTQLPASDLDTLEGLWCSLEEAAGPGRPARTLFSISVAPDVKGQLLAFSLTLGLRVACALNPPSKTGDSAPRGIIRSREHIR